MGQILTGKEPIPHFSQAKANDLAIVSSQIKAVGFLLILGGFPRRIGKDLFIPTVRRRTTTIGTDAAFGFRHKFNQLTRRWGGELRSGHSQRLA
jgi:hypothetical protein